MENRVCIVGIGLVESAQSIFELSHKELLFYSTRKALDDAGLERKDIGGAITSSYDFLEGRSLSNQFTLDSIGGVMKPCDLRLGEDGIYSLFAGYMEVMADPSKFVVVASVQKASERDPEGLSYQKLIAASMEPVFSRPVCNSIPNLLGLEPVLAAMEARAFMERSGLKEEQLAKVAVKNLNNANPGKEKSTIDLKAVLESELLSWPIRQLTRAKEADAACTLILASEKKIRSMAKPPVFIRGIGWCSDQSHLASRQQGLARETKWAAHQAYKMAGIQRPDKGINMAEVSDWYAHRELMHCEALGFCNLGEIGSCIADGVFEKEGPLPVNVSGGLLGRGNAIGTSGLTRVAQVALQIRSQANGYQVPRVEVGLAHSWSGIPAATAGVAVLSKW
jgi:acetyl-CoA C-acetyltransferase